VGSVKGPSPERAGMGKMRRFRAFAGPPNQRPRSRSDEDWRDTAIGRRRRGRKFAVSLGSPPPALLLGVAATPEPAEAERRATKGTAAFMQPHRDPAREG
jgi:hypothetical protein